MKALGKLVTAFFEDHLQVQKGLRPASVRSYRDSLKLFLVHAADRHRRPVTRLALADLGYELVLDFLDWIERERDCGARTRNQRLAALRTFYRYVAMQCPEALAEAQRVELIPTKRFQPAPTVYLERDEIERLLASLPASGPLASRDRALLTFLYNTGARAQEAADLRISDVDLDGPYRVRLHGKGGKWRACPIWPETAELLMPLANPRRADGSAPVFVGRSGRALTRFGVYKIVKRHVKATDEKVLGPKRDAVSTHAFRHTTAVHLLEAGVELNVIRGWLGHASLETTNRYAEIGMRTKLAAVEACSPPMAASQHQPATSWQQEPGLIEWLESL